MKTGKKLRPKNDDFIAPARRAFRRVADLLNAEKSSVSIKHVKRTPKLSRIGD